MILMVHAEEHVLSQRCSVEVLCNFIHQHR